MAVKIGNHGREETSTTTMGAIKKTTDANQVRLQTLELAVANLTNICIGLRDEVSSLRSILLETNRIKGGVKEAVMEMKLPYHSSSSSSSLCSDSKNDLGVKKGRRQPWKKDAKIIPAIKVQAAGRRARRSMSPIRAAARMSQKGSTRSTKPEKLMPAMATMRAKEYVRVKTQSNKVSETVTAEGLKKPTKKADGAKSVALNVKEEGVTSGKGVTLKLPRQMADAPTIRSLIYGSRNVSVVKSSEAQRPVIVKKRT